MRKKSVNALFSTEDKIFCATDNGIIFYDKNKEQFISYTEPDENLAGREIYAILKFEKTGFIYAFTNRGVFQQTADKKWQKIENKIIKVKWFYESSNALYLKTDNEIFFLKNEKVERLRGLIDADWHSIHKKKWFPATKNVYLNEPISVIDYEPITAVDDLVVTKKGYLLIYRRAQNRFEYSCGSVFDKKIDGISSYKKDIWFWGTHLSRFMSEGARYVFYDDARLDNNINDIASDGKTLFIATKNNGIFFWDDYIRSNLMMKNGLLSNDIKHIAVGKRYIYAVSKYGVSLINRYSNRVKTLKGLDYFNIKDVLAVKNGAVFLKKDEIVIYDMKQKKKKSIGSNAFYSEILTSIDYKDGKIYVGSNVGITKYDIETDEITIVSTLNKRVNDLKVADGHIYVATKEGLVVMNLNGDNEHTYGKWDGLFSNCIKKIYTLNNGIAVKNGKGFSFLLW